MLFSWFQLLTASTIAFFLKRIVCHLLDPLRVVPGPFVARFTRLWYLIGSYNGRTHETIAELHDKYGMKPKFSRYLLLKNPGVLKCVLNRSSCETIACRVQHCGSRHLQANLRAPHHLWKGDNTSGLSLLKCIILTIVDISLLGIRCSKIPGKNLLSSPTGITSITRKKFDENMQILSLFLMWHNTKSPWINLSVSSVRSSPRWQMRTQSVIWLNGVDSSRLIR